MTVEIKVVKRDGDKEEFNKEKIKIAVQKAMNEVGCDEENLPDKIATKVLKNIKSDDLEDIDVKHIHILVENALMHSNAYEVAREYITYRDRNKPDIFRPRVAYKPFEYPQMEKFVSAIQQSYWVVDEFNYSKDIQDFKVNVTEAEKNVIKNTMLAISQIEAYSVKTFWSKIYDRMPKPEISDVGATFSDSECRHSQAYSKLLEYLGLNREFQNVMNIPAIQNRVSYLKKFVAPKDCSDKEYMESILLFSLFIENVSLFSQFLIMMSFDNYTNRFTGIGNAVQSTSAEEAVHAAFGAELVNILREEHPEWFDEDLEKRVHENCLTSFESEKEIINWIFEKGSLDFITKTEVIEFIKDRYNRSMDDIGMSRVFNDVDDKVLEKFSWFDLQINTTTHADFFARRSVNYTKSTQSYDEDSLF